jgi:hypothetical protein
MCQSVVKKIQKIITEHKAGTLKQKYHDTGKRVSWGEQALVRYKNFAI